MGYTADKLCREKKGDMKKDAVCNSGFEMPSSEIAAFHLHRFILLSVPRLSFCLFLCINSASLHDVYLLIFCTLQAVRISSNRTFNSSIEARHVVARGMTSGVIVGTLPKPYSPKQR